MRQKHTLWMSFALGVLAVTWSEEVRAEIFSRVPGDFGWRKSVPLQLILNQEVVEELELNEDVVRKLRQLNEEIQKEAEVERSKGTDIDPNAPQPDPVVLRYKWNEPSLHAVRNRHSEELNNLLTSQQQERLHQIQLQKLRKPTDALCDSGFAQELGLSDVQRSEILQLHWGVVRAEMGEIKLGRKYTGPRSSGLEKQCPVAVLSVLTDEQRQNFEKLRGPPLKSKPE